MDLKAQHMLAVKEAEDSAAVAADEEATRCFVCGGAPHGATFTDTGRGHNYWPTADALREAAEHDRLVRLARNPGAAYVAEYRPY